MVIVSADFPQGYEKCGLGQLRPFRALVLGDFFLDTYVHGRVRRISPEAPVPIMEVISEESRPGGAGNTVLNLLALGGSAIVIGRVGVDADGDQLTKTFAGMGVNVAFLLMEQGYRTPVKKRLIANSQQLFRIDFEKIVSASQSTESAAIACLDHVISTVQVITISDYGKGFLSPRLLSHVMKIASRAGVPVIVDPKGTDFSKYRGATILKPNLLEAYAAAKMSPEESLEAVARSILENTQVESLLITRSEEGISLFHRGGERRDFPVRVREVKDVTGAGDTVLAVLSLGIANHLDLSCTIQLANLAAGIAIERIGCVQVGLAELAKRIEEWDLFAT